MSSINKIIQIINEKIVLLHDLYFCLNIHYDGKEKIHLFSVNARWNGNFYKIDNVESAFHEIDSKLGDVVNWILNPYKDLYFLPFYGINNFLIKMTKNRICLYDPSSKEILQNIAFFEINLHNLQIFPNFFKLIDDLALKMKLNADINLLFKYENKQAYIDAFFTFAEKKIYFFNEIYDRLTETNEFNVILKESQVQKKDIVKLFIKRMIKGQGSYVAVDALDFFSKYLVLEKKATNMFISKGEIVAENSSKKNDARIVSVSESLNDDHHGSIIPLSQGVIDDASIYAFQAMVDREGNDGKFLDSRNSIFDDGTRIFAIIHELSVDGLYSLLKRYITKRIFKFFFIDREELSEFSLRLAPALESFCEAVMLQNIEPSDALASI
ncbi:MAG: hypothetical protein Q6353_003200 [Candidatus Sigynarchaeum springense]